MPANPTYTGPTGTYTLEYLKTITDKTVRNFGLEDVSAAVLAELASHNATLSDMVQWFADPTTDREMADATGSMLTQQFVLSDEFGRAPTQNSGKPVRIGVPMRFWKLAQGFTTEFLESATPAQVAIRTIEVQDAHKRLLQTELRDALYRPLNFTFVDVLRDDLDLPVKGLYNGDGNSPVNGPNGEAFDGTHNHYLGAATLTTTAVDGLIETVAEHSNNADVKLMVNVSNAAAIRALPGFIPVVDARVDLGANAATGRTALDTRDIKNRLIGYYNGAEVWTKPWAYSNYILAVNAAAPSKALAMREPVEANKRGLILKARSIAYPLESDNFETRFGFAVKARGAAAVLYIGNATYVDPTA